MKWPDNLCKRVALVTVAQRSAVSPLLESKPSLIKHLTVLHSDIFWMYTFIKLMSRCCRIFVVFREQCLCTLKIFLFLSICKKNIGTISLCAYYGTKMLLDATLPNTAKYLKFDSNSDLLFSTYICVKNYICDHRWLHWFNV